MFGKLDVDFKVLNVICHIYVDDLGMQNCLQVWPIYTVIRLTEKWVNYSSVYNTGS